MSIQTDLDYELKSILGYSEDEEDQPDIKDIEPLAPVVYEPKESKNIETLENEDLKEDYAFARSNLYALIGKTNGAIELALKIVTLTEGSGRSMESLRELIKTSSDLTKDLLLLQKSLETKTSKKETPVVKNTQNNIYLQKQEEMENVSNILDQLDDED